MSTLTSCAAIRIVAPAHAAFEQSGHTELLADLANIDVLASFEREARRAGGDMDARNFRQGVDDFLGHAIAEILVLGIGTHVCERQDRNRLRPRRKLWRVRRRVPGIACVRSRRRLGRAFRESSKRRVSGQSRPLSFAKTVGYSSQCITGLVDHHRHEESLVVGNQVRAIDRKFPFQPEVTFTAQLGVLRDDRHEQHAILIRLRDRHVPRIAAAQFALVEPHLEPRRAQCIGDAPCDLRVLRGIAQKNGSCVFAHGRTCVLLVG
ncbi:MAG: hypothetical protein IPF84_08105 [Proteobacteria bacterium]|nr:hypothetical protein [Pseudomonadota bacterium]